MNISRRQDGFRVAEKRGEAPLSAYAFIRGIIVLTILPFFGHQLQIGFCATQSESQLITPYHAKYFAFELSRRIASDSVEKLTRSLSDAQVDLNPHQIEAALFAFHSPLSKGAMLADEVGLGKTIEAGIILSQKWAERKRRILIVVPANLRKQWNQELQDKFFLSSTILEAKSFNDEITKGHLNPFVQDEIVICSYQFARAKEAYLKAIEWDLVVIDEAHRLRNVYKLSNKISNSIKAALAHAPKVLLTATPLQNSLVELFGLVSIIDDYTFGDLESFKDQYGRLVSEEQFRELKDRLKPICQRTLRKQVREYVSFTNRIPITQEFYPSEEEQRLYHLVSGYLQRPNLYALPPSQRQLMTLILRRLLASSTYAISGTLEALALKLEETVRRHEQPEMADVLLTIEDNFEEIVDYEEEFDDDVKEGVKNEYTAEDIRLMREEIAALKEFHALAYSIKINSKGEVLRTALSRGFQETVAKGGSRKAIIFTESRRTQEYLREILEASEYASKIVLFNGSNSDPKSREIYRNWMGKNQETDRITNSKTADLRAAIVDYFRNEADIMIATEAAAEGINLQFCSLVVNYDLPWNPQRIEQRIGRCHRYGQKHDVVVVNFLNKSNAADQRVYELLSEKFQLFSGVFGASDEVLGSIESGVDFEKRIAEIYQQCRTETEIQASFDALQKELEPEIDEQLQLARRRLLENFDEEVQEKLRISLVESKEYLNRYEQQLWSITQFFLGAFANFDGTNYSFTLNRNPFPEEQIHSGPYRMEKNVEDANTYRVGHPLAQRIISACKTAELNAKEIYFDYTASGKKVTILEALIGKSGWLSVTNLAVTAFESEDHILFSGITDEGTMLESEHIRRMLGVDRVTIGPEMMPPSAITEKLGAQLHSEQARIVAEISNRNSGFFETEMTKLDRWAEDVKLSLEMELKALDKDIKYRKTEAKKILTLEQKVAAQREIKDMEKRRNIKRQDLFRAQDEVDQKKEELLGKIEQQLKQKIEIKTLFTIRWNIR